MTKRQTRYREQTTQYPYTESKVRQFMKAYLKLLTFDTPAAIADYALKTSFGDVEYDSETVERFNRWAEIEFIAYKAPL